MTSDTLFGKAPPDLLHGIRGIIFDLDDTLYLQKDFKISGFQAVGQWLEDKGHGNQQDHLMTLHSILDEFGPSYPFMFDRFAERVSLPITLVPQLVQVFIQHKPKIKLFPGALDVLKQLRRTYKLGILTDGRLQVQQAKVLALGLEPLFDAILYSDAFNLSKPAEELFTWFEDFFHLSGQELAYIADNPKKDFDGAQKRGWKTIRVFTGEYATQRFQGVQQVSAVISTMSHLLS